MILKNMVTGLPKASSTTNSAVIFIWYPDDIASVSVNGDKLFMATNGDRYLSYTGPSLEFIDQRTASATLTPFSLEQILPAGVTAETWHRIKENLGDYQFTFRFSAQGGYSTTWKYCDTDGSPFTVENSGILHVTVN